MGASFRRMSAVVGLLFAAVVCSGLSAGEGTKHGFDKKTYTKLAKKTIGATISGKVTPDAMLTDLQKLIELGLAGCTEHMSEKETPEVEKKLMTLVKENASKMTALSLKEIEAQWHEGGAAKKAGIKFDGLDHFSEAMCHYDTVVHPATCVICMNAYKKADSDDKKAELLAQVKAELQEVLKHLRHLE